MAHTLCPPEMPLHDYVPPEVQVSCPRCRRQAADLDVHALAKRFGANITMGQLAQRVAGAGKPPCALAASGQCGARALEPPVWHWANLDQAWRGGWAARLRCRRRHAALKKTASCPEVVFLDVETLIAALGYDFKLERLPSRMSCPRCHSELVDIEWMVPGSTPAPFAPAAQTQLRMRPTGAQLGRRSLRIVEGDKATLGAMRHGKSS